MSKKNNAYENMILVDQFKVNLEQHIAAAELWAKLRRAAYDAAINEGFTEDQALELCKNPM